MDKPTHPSLAENGPRLSVVVPCYNEEDSIEELHRRVSDVCTRCAGGDHELVLVNDGSRDGTWDGMLKLASRDSHVLAVNLSRNHGHQLALSAGLTLCRGDRILILDADLQDPPELLSEMMARMDAGAEVVYGQRTKRVGETWFKRFTAAVFYRLLDRLVDVQIPRDVGDFRLMSRRALDLLNSMPERHRFIRGMVSWIGLRQEALSYERDSRFAGDTKYPLSRMIAFAFDAITSFSIRPLRLASHLGLFCGAIGILMLLWVLIDWISGDTIPGWTSLMVVVLLVGSAQLLVTGMFGEYLGRLYMESKHRPLFIIQDIVRNPQPPTGETATAQRTTEASR